MIPGPLCHRWPMRAARPQPADVVAAGQAGLCGLASRRWTRSRVPIASRGLRAASRGLRRLGRIEVTSQTRLCREPGWVARPGRDRARADPGRRRPGDPTRRPRWPTSGKAPSSSSLVSCVSRFPEPGGSRKMGYSLDDNGLPRQMSRTAGAPILDVWGDHPSSSRKDE
jgi:hypothetical protein